MPTNKPKESLNIVMKAEDILKKSDFSAYFEQVLKMLLEMEKRNREAIIQLQQGYNRIISDLDMGHKERFKELKNSVNDLFVSNQLKRMDSETKSTVKNLESKINSLISEKLKEADDKLSKVKDGYTPIKGKDYFDGKNAELNLEELINNLQGKLTLDSVKDLRGILKKIAGARPMGKPVSKGAIRYYRRIRLTAQNNGRTKIYDLGRNDVTDIISMRSSQFPFEMDNVDFTLTGSTLTLGNQVAAIESGQTLIVTAETLFYP